MDFRAFEAAPGVSVIVLPDAPHFTLVAVSNDFIAASGMRRQDVVGRSHFEVFSKSSDASNFTGEVNLKASFDYIIQHKTPHEIPLQRYDIPNGDGTFSQKYWKVNNAAILSNSGEVQYIVHTALDITGRVLAEQKAESVKGIEKAFNFFMNAPVIICYVRGDDYIIELANEGMLKVWGKGKEVIGKPVVEAIPELEAQGFIELLKQVRKTGQPYYAYESPAVFIRNGKEETLYFDFTYQPYYENETHGTATGVIGVAHDVTEKVLARKKVQESEEKYKQANESIRRSNQRFEAAVNAVQGVLWTNNAIGEMEGEQPGWAAITGQRYEEYQGFGWAKAVHPNDAQPTVDAWNEAVKERKTFVFEHRLKINSGDWRLFSIRAIPLLSTDGTIREWVGVHTDITEKRLAEQALEESANRFRQMADSLPIVVWTAAPDGGLTFISQQWEIYYGNPISESLGTGWASFVHADDVTYAASAWDHCLKTGENYETEFRVWHKSGAYRWTLVRAVPIRNTEGIISSWYGSNTDIEEQKTFAEKLEKEVAERTKELQHSQTFLQQLIDSSIEYISVLDKNLRIVTVNKRYEELLKINRKEVAGMYLFDFNPKIKDSLQHQTILKALGGETIHLEKRAAINKPDIQVDTYYIPFSVQNKVEGVIIMARDISNIVRTEKLLEQANKELQRSNEDLQQFAHVASHDLKEPIRKVMTFSNRLKDELANNLPEKAANYLSKIESSALRMYSMIDGVLLYSSLNALEQTKELIDLSELIETIEADLEVAIAAKAAKIVYSGLASIEGSSILLYQLFYNLISNSIKFAKESVPPIITVTSAIAMEAEIIGSGLQVDKQYWNIKVADNGIGFSDAASDKIFATFTRLHSKDKYEGTGLGLALCRKIVERHGGIIHATGKEGEGAVFSILLPSD